jgi:F-type H+-transporting ATPase subunit c
LIAEFRPQAQRLRNQVQAARLHHNGSVRASFTGVKGPMKFVMSALLALGLLLFAHGVVSAQTEGGAAAGGAAAPAVSPVRAPSAGFADLRAVGAGLVIIGAAFGIGRLGGAAVESMARQPETAGNIQTAMIIAAALIEGVTFFALIIIFTHTY